MIPNDTVFDEIDAPLALATPQERVSLWWCTLRAPLSRQETFERWLSPAERMRMRRFGHDDLRIRYVIGRGTLRWILGSVIERTPSAVVIERGVRGRPHLAEFPQVDFNVSHTGECALIGIVRDGQRIGVDIERSDRRINASGLARKFMTSAERAGLPRDEDDARRRLLQLWTCKEAMSKATGDALSAPFARIDVEIAPSLRLVDGPEPYVPDDWTLASVDASHDHFATVALWRPQRKTRGPDAAA
jgi:4'-phosphopantetheinyl transferase